MSSKRPVSFNMPEDMLAAIDERAAAEDRSRSQWLVHFLQRHGINPHAVKDGPYDSELDEEGNRLVDHRERFHVTVRDSANGGFLWVCDEVPEARGVADRMEDVQPKAKRYIERLTGRSAAVYLAGPAAP